MTESTEPARPAFAICPRIKRNGSTRVPKLFMSESKAKRFLKSEIPPGPIEVEAQVTGLTVEQVRARRAQRTAQLRKDRKEAAEKLKRGELHPFSYPLQLRKIRNEDLGWQEPVSVSRVGDYHGPKCNRTVREFLPADALGPMPALDIAEELDRILENRDAHYTCYLDKDWRFDELEADAWKRVGHEYSGRRYGSIGEIVVRAIHDLEAGFQKFHPAAPFAAVADFWRSWQVQRHIADFCSRLSDSDTARLLTGNRFNGAEEAERARVHVYRQLAAFAHELLDEAAPSSAADTIPEADLLRTEPGPIDGAGPNERATPHPDGKARKRGPKPDHEAALRVAEIVARVAPGCDWRLNLDDICEALDQEQIPFPQRWRQRDRSCDGWAAYDERANAVKAIEYRLGIAKQRKKLTPKTLS